MASGSSLIRAAFGHADAAREKSKPSPTFTLSPENRATQAKPPLNNETN
jgi:hypothetical protein